MLCLVASSAHADDAETISHKWQQWVANIHPVKPTQMASEADKVAILRRVHLSYATYDYAADKGDHWDTPEEFKRLRRGDCEDFALAKYFDLLEAGIKDKDMYFTVINDGEPHAILVVSAASGTYVLDSKHPLSLPRMVPAEGYNFMYQANLTTVRWHNNGNLIEEAVASPLRWR